ncbi:MAG: Lpg1974 family pore-forming outer membrane protein [Planctomycetota bacterium]
MGRFPAESTPANSVSETPSQCIQSGFCSCEEPRFYATADALFLKLDQGTRQAMPVVINQDTGETALTTHDLDYNMVAGPRLAFGYRLNECGTIEASYFGLHHWDATAEVTGNNNLRLPGDLPLATLDFFDADHMRLDYSSELNNVEINYYRRTGFENLSLLVGFRYLNLNETFNIHSNDVDTGGSDYNIRATNNLFGAQFGGRWQKDWDRLGLDFVGKAGIFGNSAKQHTFVGDFDNTYVMRDSTTTGANAAFIGELGFNGSYRLTQALCVRAGYNLIWIEGLARAMDQLDFTDTPTSGTTLVIGKGAFLHGGNVGLEARW